MPNDPSPDIEDARLRNLTLASKILGASPTPTEEARRATLLENQAKKRRSFLAWSPLKKMAGPMAALMMMTSAAAKRPEGDAGFSPQPVAAASAGAIARPLPTFPVPRPQTPEPETFEDGEAQLEDEEAEAKAAELLRMQQQQALLARARAQTVEATQSIALQQSRKAFKKTAEVAIQRGVRGVMQAVFTTIGAGTLGVGFIVTAVFQLIDLGWMNVEMVYGYYLAKGKSKFISPLDWTPLPIPLHPIWLHIGVIFLDLVVLTLFTTLLIFAFILLVTMAIMLFTVATGPVGWIGLFISNYGLFTDIIKTMLGL